MIIRVIPNSIDEVNLNNSHEILPACYNTTIEIQQPESQSLLTLAVPSQNATLIRTWLRSKQGEKTRKAYAKDIQTFYAFLQETLSKSSLSQVTLEDLQDYAESLAFSPVSIATQGRFLASLKSVFTFAYKTGFLPFNVGAALQIPKGKETISQRILSEEQVLKMIALEDNPRNHAILVLLYGAGLRAAELCVLKWEDVQPRGDTGQLTVYGKRKKTRYVLLKKSTWDELQQIRKDATLGDYVFSSRQSNSRKGEKVHGRKLDESQILHIVREAARRAKIANAEEVSPHWLRHAHATHSMEHGAPIALVQATLGHESIETTGNYLHVRPDQSSAQYINI